MAISLRQLHAFAAVAETGGFTAAAERLCLTQSAVSMLVRQLETDLGLPLFDRMGRGVTLTAFGREIRPTAERMLADLQNLTDSAADLQALRRGHLRLAVPQILAATWLPGVMTRFRAAYPNVAVSLLDSTGDGVVAEVAAGDADIGLGPERQPPSNVTADSLWSAEIQIVLPRSGAGDGAMTYDRARLKGADWIHYSEEFRSALDPMIHAPDTPPTASALRVRGLTTALALVGSGHGLTAAPSYASVLADVFGVDFRSFSGTPVLRRYYLYSRRAQALSPEAVAFREIAIAAGPRPGPVWDNSKLDKASR